jgi:signal transduction histidine kinase
MENIDHGEIQDPPNPFALSDREAKMLIYIGRMALLGELFHDVVHDIRNPLSTVTLIASVIDKSRRSDEGDGASLAEKIRILESSSQQIDRVLSNVDSLWRGDRQVSLEYISLESLISSTVELVDSHIRSAGIELRISIVTPSSLVWCKRIALMQALLQLIRNARDASINSSSPWIKLQAEDVNGCIELSVVDSGKGIPPKVRDKMMQPFFTTKPPHAASGLGLTCAQLIISEHRGELFYDEEAEHTRFVIRLPSSPQ